MKTVRLEGPHKVRLHDVPIPHAFDHYAVVKIRSAPMCTEYRKYENGDECSNLGHEAAGEVVEASRNSTARPGDKVIIMPQYPCGQCELCIAGDYIHCEHTIDPLKAFNIEYGTGTFAEYMIKPDWLLLPMPDDISYDEAAMACCGLGPAFGAGKAMDIHAGDTVLVTGLGPVGLGAVIYSTYRGARVIGISRNEYRRSLAMELGADASLQPGLADIDEKIMKLTDNKGVDKVIECSGDPVHQQLALRSVKRKGQIAFIGESSALSFDVSKDLLRKGLTVHGIWHWNLKHASEIIEVIRQSKEKISKLITHVFPLEQVEEAFRLQLTANCGKVILRP